MDKVQFLSVNNIGITLETITPNVWIVRGGEGFEWGGKYTFVCVVVCKDSEAEVKGYLGLFSKPIRQALVTILKQNRVDKVVYERFNNRRRTKEVSIGASINQKD